MSPTRIGWRPLAHDPRKASCRLRCFRPAHELARAGYESRVLRAADPAGCDVIVFQKAYSPADLDLARECRRRGVATILDLCDNHFDVPADRPDLRERADRVRRMVDLVDLVTVSTPELGRVVPRPDCPVIDDALEEVPAGWWTAVRVRMARARARARGRLRLLWFGNVGSEWPRFGMIDLADRVPVLARFHARQPVELTVVSDSEPAFRQYFSFCPFPARYRPWRQGQMPVLAATHDVCLIPVRPNPFTVCKTSNRLVYALLLGLPVVADSIPSYREFADFVSLDDWDGGLDRYAADLDLRAAHVSAGRRYIAARFSRERWISQWTWALTTALAAGSRSPA